MVLTQFGDAENKKRISLQKEGIDVVIKSESDAKAFADYVAGKVSTLSRNILVRRPNAKILYNGTPMTTVQAKVAPSVSSVSSTLMQSPIIRPSLGSIVQTNVAPSVSSVSSTLMQSPVIKPSLAPSVSSITESTVSVAPTPSYLPVVVGVVILAFVFLR